MAHDSNFSPWLRKLPCTSGGCDRYDLVSYHPQLTALPRRFINWMARSLLENPGLRMIFLHRIIILMRHLLGSGGIYLSLLISIAAGTKQTIDSFHSYPIPVPVQCRRDMFLAVWFTLIKEEEEHFFHMYPNSKMFVECIRVNFSEPSLIVFLSTFAQFVIGSKGFFHTYETAIEKETSLRQAS